MASDPLDGSPFKDEIVRRVNALLNGVDFFSQSLKDNVNAVISLLLQEIQRLRNENEALKRQLNEMREKKK